MSNYADCGGLLGGVCFSGDQYSEYSTCFHLNIFIVPTVLWQMKVFEYSFAQMLANHNIEQGLSSTCKLRINNVLISKEGLMFSFSFYWWWLFNNSISCTSTSLGWKEDLCFSLSVLQHVYVLNAKSPLELPLQLTHKIAPALAPQFSTPSSP